MADLTITFEGDLVQENRVPLRVLGRTLFHLQKSLDRAYLDLNGNLYKNAKLHPSHYAETEIMVLDAYEGSFKLDLGKRGQWVQEQLERVKQALSGVNEEMESQGIDTLNRLKVAHSARINQVAQNSVEPIPYEQAVHVLSHEHSRRYGDRAILRELDQILAIIRSPTSGESFFEIEIGGTKRQKFSFDRQDAELFSSLIKRRSLSVPIIFTGRLEVMSRKNRSGRIVNLDTGKSCNIYFFNEDSFIEVVDKFRTNDVFSFIGSSLVEYEAFDPEAGDIYYIGLCSPE